MNAIRKTGVGLALSCCSLCFVACDDQTFRDKPFHDPRCDTRTVLDVQRGSTDALFEAPWSSTALLVGDSVVYWANPEDHTIRRTQISTGCTVMLVQTATSPNPSAYPSGLRVNDSTQVSLERDSLITDVLLPVSGDISVNAHLVQWSGDSVGLFDPNWRRTLVISTGARPSVRVLRDTLRSTVARGEELLDPRFYVSVWGRSTANPSPEESTWPTWATGVAHLRERPSQRIVTSLPLTLPRRLEPNDTAALRRGQLWTSLQSQSSSRFATTNATRDTIYVADTLGARRKLAMPFPLVRDVFGRKAPGDSAPALLQMFLTDSTVWLVVRQRIDSGAITHRLAEVDNYGRVRRCAAEGLEGWLIAIGELRMIERIYGAARDTSFRTVARPTPPACSVNSLEDLLEFYRRQRT